MIIHKENSHERSEQLSMVCQENYPNLVQLLLMHNANANAQDQVFPFSHGGSLESLIVTMVVSILSNGHL